MRPDKNTELNEMTATNTGWWRPPEPPGGGGAQPVEEAFRVLQDHLGERFAAVILGEIGPLSLAEGLSIAAISYYMVSLILYAAKAANAAGLDSRPELAAGATIPVVLWGVALLTRRIHRTLRA